MYFYSHLVSEVFFFLPFELPGYICHYHDYSSHNDSYSHESVTVPNKGSETWCNIAYNIAHNIASNICWAVTMRTTEVWRFKPAAKFWIWKKFDWPKIENVLKVENGSCEMKFDAHWVQVKKGFFVFFLREILSQYCSVYMAVSWS